MDKILLFLFGGMITCCLVMLYCAIRIYMIDREMNKLQDQHDALVSEREEDE